MRISDWSSDVCSSDLLATGHGRMADPSSELREVRLTTPVTDEALRGLRLGDVVYLDGLIYTGREGVYKRILQDGMPAPVDLRRLTNVNLDRKSTRPTSSH